MSRTLRCCALAAMLALVCLPGCRRKDKIIPRDKMADIYAELFVADQWIREQQSDFYDADTMRFYEPIFRKYGYTTLDFRNSANYYLQDSRRFARILQRASAKLDEQAKYLGQLSSDIALRQAEIKRLMRTATLPPLFCDSAFFARSAQEPLEMALDERGAWMPRPASSAPDSLARCDTLPRRDKLPDETALPLREKFELKELDFERPALKP